MKSSFRRQSHTYCKGKRCVLLTWLVFMLLAGVFLLWFFLFVCLGGEEALGWPFPQASSVQLPVEEIS